MDRFQTPLPFPASTARSAHNRKWKGDPKRLTILSNQRTSKLQLYLSVSFTCCLALMLSQAPEAAGATAGAAGGGSVEAFDTTVVDTTGESRSRPAATGSS